MKKELATLIVERKFQEIYNKQIESYKKTKNRYLVKSSLLLSRVVKITIFLITAMSVFILFFSCLDIVYKQTSFGLQLASMLIIFIYIIIVFVLVVLLFLIPMTIFTISIQKFPSLNYKFQGLDKYLTDYGNKIEDINDIFGIKSNQKIEVKIHTNIANSIKVLLKTRKFDFRIGFYAFLILVCVVMFCLIKIEFVDITVQKLILNIFLCLSLTVILSCIVFNIVININTRKKVANYKSRDIKYSFIEITNVKDEDFSLYEHNMFLQKVYIMRYVMSHTTRNNFIDESNYVDYIGELVETISYELIDFNEENEYFLSNERFIINKYLKDALDICISSLSLLDIEDLRRISGWNFEKTCTINKDKVLSETLNSYNKFFIGGVNRLDNTIARRGKFFEYGIDSSFRSIKTDSRVKDSCSNNSISKKQHYLKVIESKLKYFTTQFRDLESMYDGKYNRYFQPYISSTKSYGFVGYDTQYLNTYFYNKRSFCSSNMYKSYQFVLHSDEQLIKKGDFYHTETDFKNQMFFDNKLILSEQVAKSLKEYLKLEKIIIKYKDEFRNYYICKPITYTANTINSKMSLYIEEFENRLVKNSCLIEPCIIKEEAEELRLFGIESKRVTDYIYVENFKYSYIIFTNEIYRLIKDFEDIAVIKNNRGDGKVVQNNKSKYIDINNKMNLTINYQGKTMKEIVNREKFSYSKEERKKHRKYNIRLILSVIMYIIIMFGFGYFINNVPVYLFSNVKDGEISEIKIFRALYLVVPYLMAMSYFNIRKIVLSPVTTIKNNELNHVIRALPLIGSKIKQKHKIYNDDLTMSFHKKRVMFELPIENKKEYIDAEIYYNGTSYALNGVEVDMYRACNEAEKFVHELHSIFYISNEQWCNFKKTA